MNKTNYILHLERDTCEGGDSYWSATFADMPISPRIRAPKLLDAIDLLLRTEENSEDTDYERI